LTVALQAAEEAGPTGRVTHDDLKKRCLFGVTYTSDQLQEAAEKSIVALGEGAGWEAAGKVLEHTRKALPFCDGGQV
jgi:hypothetical protein